MAIEHGTCLVARWILLIENNLASVVFVNIEAVLLQVNRNFAHLRCDRAIFPAVEDAASIGSEGNDVAEDLQRWERFVDHGRMALPHTFNGCCETAEAYHWEVRMEFVAELGGLTDLHR